MSQPAYLPRALRHLRGDPRLGVLIRRHGPPMLRRTRNPFQTLVHSIVYQQLSASAAGTIFGRFRALFPPGGFPRPAEVARVPKPRLRAVGLSQQKASYVHELARAFADGRLEPRRFARMSDDELVAALTQVKGVGRWTVHMFLLFGLNRPDVLPTGDLGVQGGMKLFFGLRSAPKPAVMEKLAEPWRPYRSIGAWYMWRVRESGAP